MIITWALNLASGMLVLALLLCGWRLLRGPSVADRILALDTLGINTVALVMLLGLRWQSTLLFEVALVIALLGFVATVALARFVARSDVIE